MRHLLLLLLLILLLLLLLLPVESSLGLRRGLGGSERVERVSEIPRSVGVSVCLVVAFARRASLGARDFLEGRWFRDGGTHLHESPGALSFQTLGEDAALASPALRAVPRKVTRATRFLKLANASAERALGPSRVACEARDGGDSGAATTTGRCGLKSARFVSLCPLEGAPDAALRRIASSGEGEKNAGQSFCEPLLPETKRREPRIQPLVATRLAVGKICQSERAYEQTV